MSSDPKPSLPPALTAHRFCVGDDEFAVVSFALEEDGGAEGVKAPVLTAAEQEVLALLLGGMDNQRIAKRRGVSPSTVANQVASLFKKHGVTCRAQLVALCAR